VLKYELVQGPVGMAMSTKGILSDKQLGSHQVILRVSDGRGGVDLQAFTLQVGHAIVS
jgi:hypothetical protein